MVFLISVGVFLVTFLTGRALAIIYFYFFNKNYSFSNFENNNLFLKYIYPIISLFFIGNLSIFFNFFLPLKTVKSYIFILLFLLIFINIFTLPKRGFFFNYFKIMFPVNLLLTVSTYGQIVHYDATVYKLQYQSWLQESKIVFGHTNFRDLFGYTGIMEYISSLVWLSNNLVVVHILSVVMFTTFYVFIIANSLDMKNQFLQYSSILLLIFSILDNFGIGGGANGFLKFQMTGTYDLIFGIVFFFANIILIQNIIEKSYSSTNYFLISLLLLFSFQIRIFAVASIALYLFYSYKLIRNTTFKVRNIFILNSVLYLIFIIYTLRNLIISGCLLLPLSFTCFDTFEWSSEISSLATRGLSYYLAYPLGSNIFIWVNEWISNPKNNQIFLNFIFSFSIISVLTAIFSKNKKRGPGVVVSVLNIFFMWTVFFLTGPTPRFGMGIFLISIVTIAVFVDGFKVKFKNKHLKLFVLSISFLAVVATPRLYSYIEVVDSNFENYSILLPEYDFKESENGWGLIPVVEKDFEKCGAVYNCFANGVEQTIQNYGSYLIFKK
jgi:hypothetical protein